MPGTAHGQSKESPAHQSNSTETCEPPSSSLSDMPTVSPPLLPATASSAAAGAAMVPRAAAAAARAGPGLLRHRGGQWGGTRGSEAAGGTCSCRPRAARLLTVEGRRPTAHRLPTDCPARLPEDESMLALTPPAFLPWHPPRGPIDPCRAPACPPSTHPPRPTLPTPHRTAQHRTCAAAHASQGPLWAWPATQSRTADPPPVYRGLPALPAGRRCWQCRCMPQPGPPCRCWRGQACRPRL